MNVIAIWIGRKFYWDSGTRMSSMTLESGERFDLSDVEKVLEDGNTLTIRPCTDAELGQAYRRLREYRRNRDWLA